MTVNTDVGLVYHDDMDNPVLYLQFRGHCFN